MHIRLRQNYILKPLNANFPIPKYSPKRFWNLVICSWIIHYNILINNSNKICIENNYNNNDDYYFFFTGKELNPEDPALNGSVAKIIYESATDNIKNDPDLYFKMYQEAIQYNFSLALSEEIKK